MATAQPIAPGNTAAAIRASRANARFVPSVARPSSVTPDSVTHLSPAQQVRQFGFFTMKVLPGQSVPIVIAGDYILIRSCISVGNGTEIVSTATLPLSIRTSNNDTFPILDTKTGYAFESPFAGFSIENSLLGFSLSLQIYAGFGHLDRFNDTTAVIPLASSTSSQISRPANVVAYAANQYVGNTTTAASLFDFSALVRASGASLLLTRARLLKNSTVVLNADFTLYLCSTNSTFLGVDQTPFPLAFTNNSFLLGTIRFNSFSGGGAGSDAVQCDLSGISVPIKANTSTASPPTLCLFGFLVANAAYIPISGESFNIALNCEQY